MKNCLVTKLKAVVDNSSLLKIGEVRFYSNDGEALTVGSSSADMTVTGTSDFTYGADYVGVIDKYAVTALTLRERVKVDSVEAFEYMPLTQLSMKNADVVDGLDYSSLPKTISDLRVPNINIDVLSEFVSIQTIQTLQIYGVIENFVAGQISNGRESATEIQTTGSTASNNHIQFHSEEQRVKLTTWAKDANTGLYNVSVTLTNNSVLTATYNSSTGVWSYS